mgnify:CR=1 FL=1
MGNGELNFWAREVSRSGREARGCNYLAAKRRKSHRKGDELTDYSFISAPLRDNYVVLGC